MTTTIQEVRLSAHPLTSKSRMYPTKDGSWTKNDIENMSYEQMVAGYNGQNSESRNRPQMGIKEFAHTMLLGLPELRKGLEQGIYGPALAKLADQIEEHKEALAQLDGASKAIKTEASVNAGVNEIATWLQELSTKPNFKAMLPVLWYQGEISRHIAQQLSEWVSAIDDPMTFVAHIPRETDQLEPDFMGRLKRSTPANISYMSYNT